MSLKLIPTVVLVLAGIPFIYYVLALYSGWNFFRRSRNAAAAGDSGFTPPVSCLKPVRGLDWEAYENFASFCRQDYPEYEIVFCLDPDDPALPVIEKLIQDFPERQIRVLFGSGRTAVNDKVAKLVRLTNEAKYDLFVIADADVRVAPDYLRSVVAPFRNPKVGAATCFYVSTEARNLLEKLQSISMSSDFFAGILVAWQLDGVKFALAQTIVTTRQTIRGFGGYEVLENRPADDLYIGRLANEQGLEVRLLPYVVETVADFQSFHDLLKKRLRWMTVMRHMRPWGHLGLIFTWGLPWAILAVLVHPSLGVAVLYLGGYSIFRALMAWIIGVWGLRQRRLWKEMPLIPLWDAVAFAIWLRSFQCKTIRWRGVNYLLRGGRLSLAEAHPTGPAARDEGGVAGA